MADGQLGNVRALQRGLAILSEVSRSSGLRAGEVARLLHLPRPTVYRLLETLEEAGYLMRSASDDRFRVTQQVRALGDGFDGSTALSQTAGPVLSDLGRRLSWPIDLVTCEGGVMVVQETTHARSPLSLDRGMIGTRLPIMQTASGRTYLAFCGDADRGALIDYLLRVADPADVPLLDTLALSRMISETRARGYGVRANSPLPIPKTSATRTSSIAVPIYADGGLQGCLTIIWLTKAMEFEQGVARFFLPMRHAAAQIGDLIERSAGIPHVRTADTSRRMLEHPAHTP